MLIVKCIHWDDRAPTKKTDRLELDHLIKDQAIECINLLLFLQIN